MGVDTTVKTNDGLSVEASLRLLVTAFSTAPLVSGKKMRDLLIFDREAFRLAAVSVLREPSEVRGSRYLVTLLWTNELLIPTLSDVSLPKELVLAVARTAAKVDTQLHVRVIRYMVTAMLEGQELEEEPASRLLEVLSSVTDAVVIRPFLRQMLLHPNPRIRSKITLLVGRGQSGFGALAKLAADEDARVRANAIEALWTSTDPQALPIFRDSLRDTNNRVVGNAIFGLYLAGDLDSVEALLDLVSHQSAIFRGTAAWIMGRTKDPRFLLYLAKMLTQSNGQLRKTVFNGINTIKKAMQVRAEAAPLNVSILSVRPATQERTQIRVCVSNASLSETPDIKPTEIILLRGKEQVQPFTFEEHRSDLLAISLVLPRRPSAADSLRVALEAGIKASLGLKKRSEQWCVLRYREELKVDGTTKAPSRPFAQTMFGQNIDELETNADRANTSINFTANVTALQTAIESPGLRFDNGLLASQAITSLLAIPAPAKSTKHIVVFSDGRELLDDVQREEIAGAAAQLRCPIHAFCAGPDPQLEKLCSEANGMYRQFDGAASLELELRKMILAVRRQYILEYDERSSDAAEQIVVQVHTPLASGESTYPKQDHIETSDQD